MAKSNGVIGNCKGVKTNKSGLYWSGVKLSNGNYKIVIGELIDKENRIFKLISNSASVLMDKTWKPIPDMKDWNFKEELEEVITFFDWNY